MLIVLKRNTILVIVGFIMAFALETVNLYSALSRPTTLWVDDDDPTCGGSSPCYSTIQAAVAAAQSGDTIKVLSGTYNGPIVITKSVTLSGESKGSVIVKESASQEQPEDQVILSILESATVKIEDLTVISKLRYGVSIIGPNARVTINHVRFSGHMVAINLSGQLFIDPFLRVILPVLPSSSQLIVLGSDISDSYYGIFVSANGSYTQHIEGNQLLNNTVAITALGKGSIRVSKNCIASESRHGTGLSIEGVVEATVSENVIQNHLIGIQMRGSAQGMLEDNKITDNAGNGLIVGDTARAQLTQNQILRNGLESNALASPFFFYDPFFGFSGQGLRPSGFGIVIGSGAYVGLVENHIEGNLFGVGATQALDPTSNQFLTPQLMAQGNQIIENGWGVWLRGAEATLENNEIAQNDVIALPLDPRLVAWLEFLFPASGVLVESGQPLLQSNRITQNGLGVVLQGQSSPTLLRNQILNNSEYGIALYQKPCFEQVATELVFQGKVLGEANELSGNGQGDLCPPDYPWPEGFRK